MINKFEAVGIFASIGLMAAALFMLNFQTVGVPENVPTQAAVVVADTDDEDFYNTIANSVNEKGDISNLIIDDIVIGEGAPVAVGDTVSVHYIGTLQNGQQFDNSYLKGEPFSFTLGDAQVIAGWEQGLEGMQVGGQRILVIPPELAYGEKGIGPIPGNATLVFAIELLTIE